MTTFAVQIDKVAGCVDDLARTGARRREQDLPLLPEELTRGLAVEVGPGANPGIILRSDTFVELGNPAQGSAPLLLWTRDCERLSDGRLTIVGPNIDEAAGASLPFAQILLVAGPSLGPQLHPALVQAQYVSDQIEGYMVKSAADSLWARVSKKASAKGFSFETLGRALMAIMRSHVPQVEAMEVVFVTCGRDGVRRLGEIGAEARRVGSDIVKQQWKDRGFDVDCDLGCGSCSDKGVCDDVREIAGLRKKKELKGAAAGRG